MPSTTPKQRAAMAAAAHNPKVAKKLGIPQKVAKEFNAADKRKTARGEASLLNAMMRQMGGSRKR
jgi:uncharacterized membrane protein